ncbi:MAG: DUF2339 domain-containing protein [Synergistaceae bacterium]|jgi:uncharacterized membrane protein|nr:DUF2339 domain-containing protein [Synergistaceae bacterium]
MDMLALAVIILMIASIIGVVKIFGVGSRVSGLEKSVSDLKNEIISLSGAIRGGMTRRGDAEIPGSEAPRDADWPVAPYRYDDQVPEGTVSNKYLEAAEPFLENTAASEIELVSAETELPEEEPHETHPADIGPPRPPDEPETAVPEYAGPETEPSRIAVMWRALVSWLITEGNIWVTAGVMLFLAGFGLLFSYIHRRGWIPLELRLTGAAVVGIAMTAFGWRLRELRRTYALILQGGGIGVMYIVLVAGAKFGPVIPVGGAVIGMLLLSAFTIVLALRQEFEPLALFALLGGYAAPILVSSGSQNFVALFSIHALLNFEVFLMSLFRDWRKSRWAGLMASLAAGAAWGALRWQESYFASVEPFLILFFVNYSAITMAPLFSHKLENIVRYVSFRGYERTDMPMIVTIPFAFLFLQMAAASHTRYGIAVTCLSLGAWYLLLGKIFTKGGQAVEIGFHWRIFPVSCIIFSNLAIPFVFKQASASAIWAAEGEFLLAFAVKREKSGVLVYGLLLHAAAFVIYNYGPYLHLPSHLYDLSLRPAGLLEWRDRTSPFLMTGLIFAASALVSSYFMSRAAANLMPAVQIRGREFKAPRPENVSHLFAAYGTVWWALSVWHAAFVVFGKSGVTAFSILCLGGAAGYALSSSTERGTDGASGWNAARLLAFPPLVVAFAGTATLHLGFLYNWLQGAILHDLWSRYALNWPAFAVMFLLGFLSYRSVIPTRLRIITWGVSLFAFVSYTNAVWRVWANAAFPLAWRGAGGIGDLAAFLPLCAAAALLTLKRFDRMAAVRLHYIRSSCVVLSALMLIRLPEFIISFGVSPNIPHFYIPLLNTLELRQFMYLSVAAMLFNEIANKRARRIGFRYLLSFAAFIWLNNVAARSALRYFGERVSWGYMSDAPYFQGIIAILWGMTSIACIFAGKRYGRKPLWFAGAGLFALDVVKLLIIDLRNSATIIRIFAFLILGALFLIVGWAAPLPPSDTGRDGRKEDEA